MSLRTAVGTVFVAVVLLSVVAASPAGAHGGHGHTVTVSFGAYAVGDSGNFSLTNYGYVVDGEPLRVDRVELSGPNPQDFAVVDAPEPGTAFGDGDEMTVVVRFAPQTPGEKNATLTVYTNDEPFVTHIEAAGAGDDARTETLVVTGTSTEETATAQSQTSSPSGAASERPETSGDADAFPDAGGLLLLLLGAGVAVGLVRRRA